MGGAGLGVGMFRGRGGFLGSGLLSFLVIGFLVSKFLGLSVSKCLGFLVSKFLSSKVPEFQRFTTFPFHVFWKILIPYPRLSRFH